MIVGDTMPSKTVEWSTPRWLFDRLDAMFHFTLDPCSTDENALCERHFTKEQDGLIQPWGGERVFCNPPYGRELGKWVRKAYEESKEGATVVMLIPARTDTSYWHEVIYPHASAIGYVKGRLRFGGLDASAPFASAIVVFDGNPFASWR